MLFLIADVEVKLKFDGESHKHRITPTFTIYHNLEYPYMRQIQYWKYVWGQYIRKFQHIFQFLVKLTQNSLIFAYKPNYMQSKVRPLVHTSICTH